MRQDIVKPRALTNTPETAPEYFPVPSVFALAAFAASNFFWSILLALAYAVSVRSSFFQSISLIAALTDCTLASFEALTKIAAVAAAPLKPPARKNAEL